MDKQAFRTQAKLAAADFLENEKEYQMGYVGAEQPHPLTRALSQTYQRSAQEGVRLLFQVDAQMADRAAATLAASEYACFADAVRRTLKEGGKVIFSGCGSSGRLSMNLERSWRSAISKLSSRYPKAAPALADALERVGNIMTGGDYAVIRAAESFEDSTALGKAQARQWHLQAGDLLVGITATGETTSILGTALQALEDGAEVYMLICSDPQPLLHKMERVQAVYRHPNCRVLSLDCGPMALTGSTRMQSSTYEQFAACVALEGALYDLLTACGEAAAFPGYGWYGQQFRNMVCQLLGDEATSLLAKATLTEQNVYEQGGLITLFANDYLLDVLTDTTERAPTFMTPPFCSADMVGQPQSWAFVKNPTCNTQTAWERCFLRSPRCIEWERAFYEQLGLNARQIEKIPDISGKALQRYLIGNEPMPQRENAPHSHALWVDVNAAPADFQNAAASYTAYSSLTVREAAVTLAETFTDMFEHLCLKLMLNVLSTGVMARMGRIHGNWMTCLAMSNKKLVDRSARIIVDQCGIAYETALEELYYAKAAMEAEGVNRSPAQEVIRKFGAK